MKATSALITRCEKEIAGVLSCFDRFVVTGTLTEVAHPEAMADVLYRESIRCFDIGQLAEPLRERIRDNALEQAQAAGVEYLSRGKGVRKEELVAKVLARRGSHPGLVQVLSVMEACTAFKPWHDKKTGKTVLKMVPGKCVTSYFYLIDPELGLLYVRVPTWLPSRWQIDFNVHHWLAAKLQSEGIDFAMEDNAFVRVSNWKRAQELVARFSVQDWEKKFHALAARFAPVVEKFPRGYHWSVMQAEHSLDVVFQKREVLTPLYEEVSRQAVLSVRVPDMARFWGKRYSPEAEAQSDFKTLVEGTRIKHALGRQSIKMVDKGGRVLRIEATSKDIPFFRHHRKVVGRDGQEKYKMAALKKSIDSLSNVVEILSAACWCYLEFIGILEDRTPACLDLDPISAPVRDLLDRSWRGFNLFLMEDRIVLLAILRGDFTGKGLKAIEHCIPFSSRDNLGGSKAKKTDSWSALDGEQTAGTVPCVLRGAVFGKARCAARTGIYPSCRDVPIHQTIWTAPRRLGWAVQLANRRVFQPAAVAVDSCCGRALAVKGYGAL